MPTLIRPKKVDAEKYLLWLFQKTENDIINEILRKRRMGYVDYAEVAALERIQGDLQTMVDQSQVYVPKMIEKRFYGSNKDLYGYSNARAMTAPTNKIMMETLADNLLGEIIEATAKAATTAATLYTIARLDEDALRKAALSSTAYAEALGKGAYASAELMEATIRNHGIISFVDKAGRHWSLTDYCNMAARTTARQAEVAGVLSKDDHDLYQIVQHPSACGLCATFQGRVYSKSGTNPNYPPLSIAFGKIDPNGGDDLSNTYLNIHPNCLCTLIQFTEMGKTDKQLQKIREFSNPETNPLNRDPRSKKQIEAYREKERNRARLLRELRNKQAKKVKNTVKAEEPIRIKDIAKQIEKNGFAENIIAQSKNAKAAGTFFEKIGFNKKPTVVNESKFDSIMSNYPVLYRGVSSEEYEKAFIEGQRYISTGFAGAGTNTTINFSEALGEYANEEGRVITMKLKPDAKVINANELTDIVQERIKNNPDAGGIERLLNKNPGVVAAELGYDAIYEPNHDWYNVLNRSALYIKRG